jgi:hypothetical protein
MKDSGHIRSRRDGRENAFHFIIVATHAQNAVLVRYNLFDA